jgi:hypothetical protein
MNIFSTWYIEINEAAIFYWLRPMIYYFVFLFGMRGIRLILEGAPLCTGGMMDRLMKWCTSWRSSKVPDRSSVLKIKVQCYRTSTSR